MMNAQFNAVVNGVPAVLNVSSYCDVWSLGVITKVANCMGCVRYLPVRPRENAYDKNYYMK